MRRIHIPIMVVFLLALSSCAISQRISKNDLNCPDAPKCVSSQDSKKINFIEPFTFSDQPENAILRLKSALLSEKRVTIIEETSTYIKAEVRSLIFRFVDDVEFRLSSENSLIKIRSSARIGYFDFGVNRRRIEKIRKLFDK